MFIKIKTRDKIKCSQKISWGGGGGGGGQFSWGKINSGKCPLGKFSPRKFGPHLPKKKKKTDSRKELSLR